MEILEGLNKEQRQAVEQVNGPVIVFAGAGTGKTKTLTTRIAYMISEAKIDPKNILAITFTKKATNEMRERVSNLVGYEARYVTISTIHALCARILRQSIMKLGYDKNFEIIDDDDANKIIADLYKELDISRKYFSPKAAYHLISAFKNGIGDLNGVPKQIYDHYQKRLKKNNQVDFDDLLVLTEEIFVKFPDVLEHFQRKYQYILVDEFQDTNIIQYHIIKLLAGENANLFVVGDDDQSIYSFRGANVTNMYQFSKDYPDRKMYKLVQNYRSTNAILKGSNNLISHNRHREEKELFSTNEGSLQDITIHDSYYYEDEPRYIVDEIKKLVQSGYQYKDIALLYRSNVISRNLELAFIEAGIPYQIYGGFAFLKRKEIKDIISYLKFIVDQENIYHFKRIINLPTRGIGDKTIEKLIDCQRENNCTLFEAIDIYASHNPSSKTEALSEFKNLIIQLRKSFDEKTLPEFYDELLSATKYKEFLLQEEDEEEHHRVENIMEFKSILVQLELRADLEGLSNALKLEAGFDDVILDETVGTKQDINGVILSTVHSVKGLEFKVVFVVALEEGIFPSLKEDTDMEEERRIAYVAFTRAKEKVYLTCVTRRLIYGRVVLNQKSRFITEYIASQDWKERLEQEEEVLSDLPIKVGDRVHHCNFGDGLVISEQGNIIQVLFDKDHSLRMILKDHPSMRRK